MTTISLHDVIGAAFGPIQQSADVEGQPHYWRTIFIGTPEGVVQVHLHTNAEDNIGTPTRMQSDTEAHMLAKGEYLPF